MFRAVSPLSIPMSPCLFEGEGPCCALCMASQLGMELQWALVFSLADTGADFPSDEKSWNAFTHAAFRGGRLKWAQKLFLKQENPFYCQTAKWNWLMWTLSASLKYCGALSFVSSTMLRYWELQAAVSRRWLPGSSGFLHSPVKVASAGCDCFSPSSNGCW